MAKSKDNVDATTQRIATLEMNLDNLYRRMYVLDRRVGTVEENLNATGYWYSFRGSVRWLFRQGVLMVLPLIILGAILLYMNGGPGGQNFQDYTTIPLYNENQLEVVASLPSPPGNVAVSHNTDRQRIFFTFHPEYDYAEMKVAEYDTNTQRYSPYPNKAFQSEFKTILSVRIDHHNNILYALDFAHYGMGTMSDPIAGLPLTKRIYGTPRIFGFSLRNNSLVHEYAFDSSIAGIGSMLNDFVISPQGDYLYIADTSLFRGAPSLVVYHVPTRTARRVLDSHNSMYAEKYTPSVEGSGPVVAMRLFVVRPHVDSIGISSDGKYLYYAPFSHEYLFRIRTEYLHDTNITDKQLDNHVEIYSKKSMSDGIIVDKYNNVYLTDIEHSCINIVKPDNKQMTTLVQSQTLLRWPDGLSLDKNEEYLYITASALHIKFRGDKTKKFAPYHIVRVKLDHQTIGSNTGQQKNTNQQQYEYVNSVPSYTPPVVDNNSVPQQPVNTNTVQKPSNVKSSVPPATTYQNIYGEL